MDIFKKNSLGAKATRNADDVAAMLAKLAADQDYIAMMTDVELESDADNESTMESEDE